MGQAYECDLCKTLFKPCGEKKGDIAFGNRSIQVNLHPLFHGKEEDTILEVKILFKEVHQSPEFLNGVQKKKDNSHYPDLCEECKIALLEKTVRCVKAGESTVLVEEKYMKVRRS